MPDDDRLTERPTDRASVRASDRPTEGDRGADVRPNRLTVVSGPAGVGKGTVVARLAAQRPEVWVSVSATTRAPRPGEVDGVHYLFVSDTEFDAMAERGDLLEWAVVHGSAKYGTPRAPVLRALAGGRHAILEIDPQGARQVRSSWPDALFVFLRPPSWDELARRLAGRGTETTAQQQRRLQTAREELARIDEFDAAVLNDDVDSAVARLVSLMGLSAQAPGHRPDTDPQAGPGQQTGIDRRADQHADDTIREGNP